MLTQWQSLLAVAYPGCDPNEVCLVSAGLTRHLNTSKGAPDLHLRELGRMLKGHLEKDCRGMPRSGHEYLLATYRLWDGGACNLQLAKKKARLEVGKARADSRHWLHVMSPVLKDGVLLKKPEPIDRNLGQLLREQLGIATQTS
jgi:hypothetical protein